MFELEPCQPPFWAASGHQQTVFGHILPSPKLQQKGQRVEVALPDGDRLVSFLQSGDSKVLVYLFHGLAGSIDSTYMHRTALLMLRAGHSVMMTNHRSCGEGARLARAPYHSGRGEDLSAVIARGRELFPSHKHLAIGFSLSGNALLTLVTGMRGSVVPDLAISVNAPIDLHQASAALSQGFNRVYDFKFYRQCRRDVMYARDPAAPVVRIPRFSTLREFDQMYTAPAGGFKNRDDYYTTCSTAPYLRNIKVPTILLTAADDPFVIASAYREAVLSPSARLHIEPFGGHMGYITKTRTPLGSHRWQDYALDTAVRSLLS